MKGRGWALLASMIALAGPLSAQAPPGDTAFASTTASPDAITGWARYSISPHPWNPTVAITVVLPLGSSDDREGRAGTAWLLGESVRRTVFGELDDVSVDVSVAVDRGHTVYSVLVARDEWERALVVLEEALFGRSFEPVTLESSRSSLQAVFAFETDLPVREFESVLYDMLTEGAAHWGTDPRGTPESIEVIDYDDLLAFRQNYRRSNATLSLAGGLDIGPAVRDGAIAEARNPSALESREGTEGGPWSAGYRLRVVREITSGWIAAAYPVAPWADRTALEFFIHRVRHQLVTDPPFPGLFSAELHLEELPGGGTALLIQAAVLPEAMAAWESRIQSTVERVAAEEHDPEFFRAYRRRFRSERLLADSSPEAQGLRATLDLDRLGRVRDLSAETRNLEAADLASISLALGEPRILVFGPDLSESRESPLKP